MNLLLAIVLFAILLSGIGVQTATTTIQSVSDCVIPSGLSRTTCEATDPVSPAKSAGLHAGDVIVSVDGHGVNSFAEASAIIRANPGRTMIVVVERNGVAQSVNLTPVAVTQPVTDATGHPVLDANGKAKTQQVGFAGIRQQTTYERQPIWAGPEAAFQNVGAVAAVVWQLPVKVYETGVSLVTGQPRDPNGPLSVVGAGVLAGEVASADAPVLNRVGGMLSLLASLNIALFVFNMVPLLPLDGGHIAVALWDGGKRTWAKIFKRPPPKPVDATKLVPVTFVVVIALVIMGAVLILADIFNPVTIL
jgi:membrane-associated protease RseP (regulator of RpoE activity)